MNGIEIGILKEWTTGGQLGLVIFVHHKDWLRTGEEADLFDG